MIPYAWNDEPWWSDDQVLNLHAIVDDLKRRYNIDENRVVVAGVSDGGTGAYYVAMRDTTPYASFLPLNGYIMVLANGEIDDGRNFPNNLRNKPLFVVNGGKDRLYPISIVEPYTRHLMKNGVEIEYHPQPDGEHNTNWWPEIKDAVREIRGGSPARSASGQADVGSCGYGEQSGSLAGDRCVWSRAGRSQRIARHQRLHRFARHRPLFSRPKVPGRVDLVRSGNTVQATTKGVTAFTLLLSPDRFDFSQPVIVTANGREVFHARVQPSVDTLLKWAARDNDRTMLYAAEIKIKLK